MVSDECLSLNLSAAACHVAVKILSPKFERLSYHYSRALHYDAYYSTIINSYHYRL